MRLARPSAGMMLEAHTGKHFLLTIALLLMATSNWSQRSTASNVGGPARDGNDEWPRLDGELDSVQEVVGQVLDAAEIELPPAFTLDVGLIEDKGWAVIEFNPVWCSGFLGCDLEVILGALDIACWCRQDLPEELSQWVIER